MNDPQVSVLISVYNGAQTLKRCLESVCNQTYSNIAIVLIDDASTDGSLDLARDCEKKFPHISFSFLQNEQNLGLTRSLNRGLDTISSPFTARIDEDDWWHPDKIVKQVAFLASHPGYGIVGCQYVNYQKNKGKTVIVPETDEEIRRSIIKRNPFAHSCVLFRTALIKELGGYDETVRYGQDYELWLRLFPHTKFYNLQESLCYRSVDKGISLEKQKAQMWQGVKTQVKYIQKYRLSVWNYVYLSELILLIVLPTWIKQLKRNMHS